MPVSVLDRWKQPAYEIRYHCTAKRLLKHQTMEGVIKSNLYLAKRMH